MDQVLGPGEGERVDMGGLGARFMIDSATAGGGFALVEHPIAPRTLAAPLHRHANEDEYSYVLEGRVGVQLGDETLEAGPGELVSKPRNQWHAFWNPGDEPARLLEIISPGGFERYFEEMLDAPPQAGPPQLDAIAATAARYGLELDFDSVPELIRRFGVTLAPRGD